MAPKATILEQMVSNPKKDWKIKDVEKLCNSIGMDLLPPRNGSHFKVISKHLRDILTVPAHRPIKPVYIRHLVSYAEAHLELEKGQDGTD